MSTSAEWYGAKRARTYISTQITYRLIKSAITNGRKAMLSEAELQHIGMIQSKLRTDLAATEGNKELNKRARDRARAKAILGAREAIREIRESAAAREADESGRAYKALFGIRPDRAGEDRQYRDGLAARNLSAAEARALYAQAHTRGDELAMTAIAELAWQHRSDQLDGSNWIPILEAHAGTSAALGNAAATLVSIEQPSKLDRLQEKMAMEVPVPSDMHGDLNYLAQDDEPSGDRPIGMPWGA